MNQNLWKEWLENIFGKEEFDVYKNERDGARNVYVCRKGEKKRLLSVWPNRGMYNVVIQAEVKEMLDQISFAYAVEAIIEGNRYDYRMVSETHVLQICKEYMSALRR